MKAAIIACLVGVVLACTHPVSIGGGLSSHMRTIRFCESSNNYQAVSKIHAAQGGYATGAFQFTDATWGDYHTGYKHAKDAPASLQDQIAVKHQAKFGDAPWAESRPCQKREEGKH